MLTILAILLCIGASQAIVCPEGICSRIRCAGVAAANCDGRVDPTGGYCGCCPVCMKQLDHKDTCMDALLGVVKSTECGSGLYCHPDTKACEYDCKFKRQAMLDKVASIPVILMLGLEPPKCNDDGSYGPIQCMGSMCSCTDNRGTSLHFGVGRWLTDGMNCNCELDKAAHAKKYHGAIGKIFRCKENGNYEDIQCEGSVCFCVDEVGKQLEGAQGVNIGEMNSLNC